MLFRSSRGRARRPAPTAAAGRGAPSAVHGSYCVTLCLASLGVKKWRRGCWGRLPSSERYECRRSRRGQASRRHDRAMSRPGVRRAISAAGSTPRSPVAPGRRANARRSPNADPPGLARAQRTIAAPPLPRVHAINTEDGKDRLTPQEESAAPRFPISARDGALPVLAWGPRSVACWVPCQRPRYPPAGV